MALSPDICRSRRHWPARGALDVAYRRQRATDRRTGRRATPLPSRSWPVPRPRQLGARPHLVGRLEVDEHVRAPGQPPPDLVLERVRGPMRVLERGPRAELEVQVDVAARACPP